MVAEKLPRAQRAFFRHRHWLCALSVIAVILGCLLVAIGPQVIWANANDAFKESGTAWIIVGICMTALGSVIGALGYWGLWHSFILYGWGSDEEPPFPMASQSIPPTAAGAIGQPQRLAIGSGEAKTLPSVSEQVDKSDYPKQKRSNSVVSGKRGKSASRKQTPVIEELHDNTHEAQVNDDPDVLMNATQLRAVHGKPPGGMFPDENVNVHQMHPSVPIIEMT